MDVTEPVVLLRQRLAEALAMLEREQVIDFNGHFSARLPDGTGLLINAADSVRSRIESDDFVEIDFDGRPFGAQRTPPMEFHLHAQIYRQRPDVQAVVHAHPRWSNVLSTVGQEWRPVTMQAAVLREVRTYPTTASINTAELGADVATFLGSSKGLLLRRHGLVCVGGSVLEAFVHAIYLEENAERQFQSLQIGAPEFLDRTEIEVIGRGLSRLPLFQKVWDYFQAKHLPAGRPAGTLSSRSFV